MIAGGAVRIGAVDPEGEQQFEQWLAQGRNASMDYMANYREIRREPELLLPGAKTLLAYAFPYYTEEKVKLPIALYARGRDYHLVIREMLAEIARELPGQSRICVDSAPLRERYWAWRAGLGAIGRNNQLYVPEMGSYCFLGFILTTAELDVKARRPKPGPCGDCRRCIDACPGKCLSTDGSALDARTCQSYLTVEHRGELTQRVLSLAGCDICQRVCPLNQGIKPTEIEAFHPTAQLASLSAAELLEMGSGAYKRIFKESALRRLPLPQMKRNLRSAGSAFG